VTCCKPGRFVCRAVAALGSIACACALTIVAATASSVRFHADDPLGREPETQDASRVTEWTIDLFVDLTLNLFATPAGARVERRAANINTIDEVPDSGWFTNRIVARPVPIAEAVRGPRTGGGPADGRWTIVGAKETGAAPGFTIQDRTGETWLI
jgi:hypothetical protein